MRKSLVTCALAFMSVWLLTGCEQKQRETLNYDLEQTGLIFQKNGSVTEVIVDTFAEEYYDADELKKLIEEEVADIDAIKVTEAKKTEDNQLCLKINYASGDALAAYEAEYIGVLNYEDAIFYNGAIAEAGIENTQDFVDVNGEAYDISSIKKPENYQVAYSNQAGIVQVEGYIYCYSNGLTLIDNNSVEIPEGGDGFIIYEKGE